MPTKTTIDQLANHIGQTVTLQGWLYNSRSSGKLLFLIVRDGTGLCQCVLEKSPEQAELFASAGWGRKLRSSDRPCPGRPMQPGGGVDRFKP